MSPAWSEFDAQAALLRTPGGLADPYPIYRRLRQWSPVGRCSLFGDAWLVTGHAEVAAALRDGSRLSMEQGLAPPVPFRPERAEEYKAFVSFVSHSMLVHDGRSHRRIRTLVARSFTAPAVAAKGSRVRQVADELLAPLAAAGEFDLAQDLAHRLPTLVIADLVGLPREDTGRLRQWASDLTVFLGGGGTEPEERLDQALASTLAMWDYFAGQLEERRREPAPGLLGDLLADPAEERLKDKEIIAQCMLLFTAGHQTTADLIANGAWLLLADRARFVRLCDRPKLLPAAVEECLRYESPVQMAGRLAVADFELAGQRIAAGERVVLVPGAANRDPARFPAPDDFLLPRPDNPHLAFGTGPHQCLGAFLARAEGQAAFAALLEHAPDLCLAGEPVRDLNVAFRRVESLPVVRG